MDSVSDERIDPLPTEVYIFRHSSSGTGSRLLGDHVVTTNQTELDVVSKIRFSIVNQSEKGFQLYCGVEGVGKGRTGSNFGPFHSIL